MAKKERKPNALLDDTAPAPEMEETEEIEAQPGEEITVDLDAPDEADEADEGGPSRDEKRKSRWTQNVEARRQAEERAQQIERENAELRGRLTALEQRPQYVPQQPAQQQPQADPYAEEEKRILRDMDDLRRDFSRLDKAKMTDEDGERFQRRWQEYDTAHKTIIARREAERIAKAQAGAQPVIDPAGQAAVGHVRMNYPDIADNELAMNYAVTVLQQKVLERARVNGGRREPPTMQMLDHALQLARKEFGTGPAQITNATRAKFSGMPAMQNGSNGKTNGSRVVKRVLTKTEKKMAEQRFNYLVKKKGPEAAHAAFIREQAEDDA